MNDGLIIPLAGMLVPLILVPTIITLKFRQRKREWLHQERLRAIEMGMPPHLIEPRVGAGTMTAIGAGVPIVSVVAAFMTGTWIPDGHPDYLPLAAVAWGCALLISGAALATSLLLGYTLGRARKGASDQALRAKEALDPDAYDVVSMRG